MIPRPPISNRTYTLCPYTTLFRSMVNLLPLANGEIIQTVLPLPEDEEEWKNLHVVFVTALGCVRRNSMDSFTNVPTNGKIAMRFDEGATDRLIGVALLTEGDDEIGRAHV